MDKKSRLIIFVLIVLLLGALGFAFMTLSSREALRKEFESTRERLTKENEALAKKAAEALEEKKNLQMRFDEIKRQLDSLSKDKAELERRYDTISRERDTLLERLKRMTPPPAPSPRAPIEKPQTEDVYWAGVLKEKANLEMVVDQLKKQVDSFRLQVEELKNAKSALELEIKNISQDKEEIGKRLSYTENLIDSLSLELVREKKEKRRLEDELKMLKNEHRSALGKINTLNEEKLNLEKKIQQVENEKSELERKLKEANVVLERKLLEERAPGETQTSQAVELPPIVVRSPEAVSEPSVEEKKVTARGKVLAVNREHSFIVIDLGEEQGIKIGDLFSVYRNNQKIADIEVIQTRKSVSACDIRYQSTAIKVGDTIK